MAQAPASPPAQPTPEVREWSALELSIMGVVVLAVFFVFIYNVSP